MTPNQFKHILRGAVLAALPVTQIGCMAPTSATLEPSKPVATQPDPCREPETRQSMTQESLSAPLAGVKKPLSTQECMSLCRNLFEKRQDSPYTKHLGFLRLENFEASDCATTPVKGGLQLECTASYTVVNAAYTYAPGCASPQPLPMPGRMPAGLHYEEQTANPALGQYFAAMTAMESAAVTAFRYLLRELEAYQAPAGLIALARTAIREEIEHAQMAGLLAKACAANVPKIQVDDFQLRTLAEIARENAVEGCVNETFAAACGMWQYQHAELAVFREVIGHITEEETGHAALSWAIHEWVMPQLTPAEQAGIRHAQAEAVARLEHGFEAELHPAVRRAVGLPDREQAARLFGELRNSVWTEERLAA